MNYAALKPRDIANGSGVRVSLFVSGCRHRCPDCFNREAWDFSFGKPYTQAVEQEILSLAEPSYIAGLSLLGGEPFEPENRDGLLSLLEAFDERFPDKTVWCYSGFTLEELLKESLADARVSAMLSRIDVLVDGRYIKEQKDVSLLFRGSANQRIINLPRSLQEGQTVLLDGVWKRTMGSGNIEED